MSTQNSYAQFLDDFRETIVSATAQLRGIPADESSIKPDAESWSRKEILGHLVDSAANNHQRFVLAQFKDDLVFPGYDGDRWVSVQRYRDESWPDLIQLWSSYNVHLLHVFFVIQQDTLTKSRTEHTLDKIASHLVPGTEPTTLEYLIRDYVDHLRHHLRQILGETS